MIPLVFVENIDDVDGNPNASSRCHGYNCYTLFGTLGFIGLHS